MAQARSTTVRSCSQPGNDSSWTVGPTLVRGLVHSDGYRFTNTGRNNWSCPRYGFTQVSDDIRAIFCHACDRLDLHWTKSGSRTIYISRKADVERMDEFIGPKR
jgi:hypothetical protein